MRFVLYPVSKCSFEYFGLGRRGRSLRVSVSLAVDAGCLLSSEALWLTSLDSSSILDLFFFFFSGVPLVSLLSGERLIFRGVSDFEEAVARSRGGAMRTIGGGGDELGERLLRSRCAGGGEEERSTSSAGERTGDRMRVFFSCLSGSVLITDGFFFTNEALLDEIEEEDDDSLWGMLVFAGCEETFGLFTTGSFFIGAGDVGISLLLIGSCCTGIDGV